MRPWVEVLKESGSEGEDEEEEEKGEKRQEQLRCLLEVSGGHIEEREREVNEETIQEKVTETVRGVEQNESELCSLSAGWISETSNVNAEHPTSGRSLGSDHLERPDNRYFTVHL